MRSNSDEFEYLSDGDFCLQERRPRTNDKQLFVFAAFMAVYYDIGQEKRENSGGILLLQVFDGSGDQLSKYFNINVLQFFYVHAPCAGAVFT